MQFTKSYKYQESIIEKLFKNMDKNGDGVVTKEVMMKHSNNCKTDPLKVFIVQIDPKPTIKPKLRNFLMVYHDGSNIVIFVFVRSSRRSART